MEFNVLDVNNLRRVYDCPPHFFMITKSLKGKNDIAVRNWIYENTQGRFYFSLTTQDMTNHITLGFESERDMFWFELNYDSKW